MFVSFVVERLLPLTFVDTPNPDSYVHQIVVQKSASAADHFNSKQVDLTLLAGVGNI